MMWYVAVSLLGGSAAAVPDLTLGPSIRSRISGEGEGLRRKRVRYGCALALCGTLAALACVWMGVCG